MVRGCPPGHENWFKKIRERRPCQDRYGFLWSIRYFSLTVIYKISPEEKSTIEGGKLQ